MKITIISPSFGRFGGLESFVLTLTRGLVDAGQQVETLFKQTKDFKLGGDLSEAVKSSGLKAGFCRRAGADLFRSIARSDVVHVQNPCPDVLLMARALGKPVLINVINHSRGHGSARERLWHQCLKRGDRRFYISEFVRKSWEGPGRWPGSEVVFPVCALPKTTSSISGRAGFCFVSRLIPNKGLEELLPAYAAAGLPADRWPLHIIGDGPMKSWVEQFVRDNAIRGVTLHGFVGDREKHSLMGGARFIVIPPNTREDFGLVALEARSLGVPCIISRDGGLPEAAGSDVFSFEPGDAVALRLRLIEASQLPQENYEAMCRNTNESLQSALVGAAKYIQTYRELTGA